MGQEILFDQTDDFDGLFSSFRGETNADVNMTVADDFTVPAGTSWLISEVFVDGEYRSHPDPHPDGDPVCLAADIGFWSNLVDRPSDQIHFYENVAVQSDDGGKLTFAITETSLTAGTYWMSVQCIGSLDIDSNGARLFYWTRNDDGGASPLGFTATSIDPVGTQGYPTSGWNSLVEINGYNTGLDMSFRLSGISALDTAAEDWDVVSGYSLKPAYPNPFNPQTTISFDIPKSSSVSISVMDLLGRKVETLVQGKTMPAGGHSVRFDAEGLNSGTYIVRMQAGDFVQVRSLVLLK